MRLCCCCCFVVDDDADDADDVHVVLCICSLVAKFDPELAQHLQSNDLSSSLYGLRWITTLMAREFPIPAVRLSSIAVH